MIIAKLLLLLLLGFVVWIISSRRRGGRRAALAAISDKPIPYPSRQLGTGLSLRLGSAGPGRNVPLAWLVSIFALTMLLLAALGFLLRFILPIPGLLGLGYLAMLVLGGTSLPALKLPPFGLGQPCNSAGEGPPGAALLTLLLLAFLTNAAVQKAMRAMKDYAFDLQTPNDTADIALAGLLLVTFTALLLRPLAERSDTR